MIQIVLFVAVIATATALDIYFNKNNVEFAEIETESTENTKEQNSILLISQTTNTGVKTLEQKYSSRKFQIKSHDKFVRKNYQLRNFQILKAEVQTQTTPLINSYHYLAFKNFFFTDPDDDLLKS